MRISRSDQIAGQPIKRVRDFLRRLDRQNGAWSKDSIADWLGINSDGIDEFMEEMLSRRYLRASPDASGMYYECGEEAPRLTNARLTKPISRAKADALIEELLSRVAQVNKNDELVYAVAEVRIFGSYLGQSEELGDIDLAVKLRVRRKDIGVVQQLLARAAQSGRSFATLLNRLAYAQQEVLRILKAKSPYLSLHDIEDLNGIGAASQVIYAEDPR